MTRIGLLTLLVVAALLAGCGGSGEPAAPAPLGSESNPAPARADEPGAEGAAGAGEPGFSALLEQQSGKPRDRFSPCNLVSRRQAGTLLGEAVRAPVEAPQGPTCVYRTERGNRLVTVAVQALPFDRVARKVRDSQRVQLARHTAVCGTFGQPVVYVELPRRRVLSITAPCAVGLRFATTALRELA
jgi:hypothetical protein